MTFRIQPHVRLQEWVAEDHGFFHQEGLDYEFEPQGLAGAASTTSSVRAADLTPGAVTTGALEDMAKGRSCDISSACHWAVNAVSSTRNGRMWGQAYSICPSGILVAPESPIAGPRTWRAACRWASATTPAVTTRPCRSWSSSWSRHRS